MRKDFPGRMLMLNARVHEAILIRLALPNLFVKVLEQRRRNLFGCSSLNIINVHAQ